MTRLDEFAPISQFREVHRIHVRATAERAYRAIKEVTAGEIRWLRVLTWLRRLGRSGPESVLDPPSHAPILEVATRTGFLLLADSPAEIVVGMVVIAPRGARRPGTPEQFRALTGPGHAKATTNFGIDRAESGCVVTTETRVWAADPRTERRFRRYWWAIRPGSGLIRRMWLRAIRRRAEG